MDSASGEIKFGMFNALHALEVAELHINNISTGFISSLGADFVTALYESIAQSNFGFGLIAQKNYKVIGFVAFATDLCRLYKYVLLKRGLKFVFMLAKKMFSLETLKKMVETLFYPIRIKKINLSSAELLAIAVAKEQQGCGLAFELLQRGLQECAIRKIDKVKVLVGADNKPANRLYLKCGFKCVGQIHSHDVVSNVYIAETSQKSL